tara:strand:- start:4078 stop:4932 length:855 start_codon:yes stop_codon:yes gene_type:complete
MKILKYFFQSIFIYSFFLIIRIIGLNISRKIFSVLFNLIGPFARNKKMILKNLSSFPRNISMIEKKQIIKDMWSNYGMTFVEYIFLKKFRNASNHISIKGDEIIQKVKDKNKPVIFISGHFANFELMSMEITKKKIQLATIYRPLNNYFLNPFMERLRKRYICKNQIKKGIRGVRESIDYIKKGYSVALMIDQRVSEGELINFFGKPALTSTLPAQLAIKFKLNIVPVFIKRTKNNNFELEFHEEIDTSSEKDKTELTKNLNLILERMIVKNPNQWIWTHNRWK